VATNTHNPETERPETVCGVALITPLSQGDCVKLVISLFPFHQKKQILSITKNLSEKPLTKRKKSIKLSTELLDKQQIIIET